MIKNFIKNSQKHKFIAKKWCIRQKNSLKCQKTMN